jgi:hypothetical protein
MIVNFVLVAVVCKFVTVTLMECDNMFHTMTTNTRNFALTWPWDGRLFSPSLTMTRRICNSNDSSFGFKTNFVVHVAIPCVSSFLEHAKFKFMWFSFLLIPIF